MQRFAPVSHDLQPWLEAAVLLNSPAALAQSRFPAMVSSMLVVRLSGEVRGSGEPVPPAAWISATTSPTAYEHCGAVRAVGLVLRPESAAALWPRAGGLVNTVLPLAELAGEAWAAWQPRVQMPGADDGDDARVGMLCQFIREVASPPSPCEQRRLIARALLGEACDDPLAPEDPADHPAAQRLPLSTRQLERRFAAMWGMSPKQFQIIARLNTTLQHAVAAPGSPGAHIAADRGYYDQSHMGRDMRRLAGQPLQGLVQAAQAGPPTAHWPLRIGAAQARQHGDQAAPPGRKR